MKYPFEFAVLLLTDKALDVLGFSEYWAGSGEFGHRSFGERFSKHQYKTMYRLIEHDDQEDPSYGYDEVYGHSAQRITSHFSSDFNAKDYRNIYFIHDLYEDIKANSPDVLKYFIEKTKEQGVNMYPYIESYLKYKENEQEH